MGVDVKLFGFTDRLSDYIREADFAIARAGASTLWELTEIYALNYLYHIHTLQETTNTIMVNFFRIEVWLGLLERRSYR